MVFLPYRQLDLLYFLLCSFTQESVHSILLNDASVSLGAAASNLNHKDARVGLACSSRAANLDKSFSRVGLGTTDPITSELPDQDSICQVRICRGESFRQVAQVRLSA